MNSHKIRVIVFGGSHAGSLFKVLKKELSPECFEVINHTVPGHTLENFTLFPKQEELRNEYYLIIFTGGNNVFKKNIEITRNSNNPKKIIHLTECVPEDISVLEGLYNKLGEKMDSLKCKKIVIQNPFRHLHCCKSHNGKFPMIIATQSAANKCLKQCLQEKATICCHFKLFEIPCRLKRKSVKYSKLLPDKVHFTLNRYILAARNLGKIITN
jgi:hypothetical protein